MPRTGGVYSPPAGTKGVPNTTIQSVPYNTLIDDLTADANAARPITAGGTGATSASAARTALGVAIGTNVQAYDAGLQSISGLVTVADQMIYTTALDVYATTALTPFARTLLDDANASTALTTLGVSTFMKTVLDDADAATARATLGLTIGTNVQAYDALLQSISGLTTSANQLIYLTATDTAAVATITAYGRSLIDDADASTALTTLGVSAFMKTVLDDADAATARATLGANNASNLTTGTVADAVMGAATYNLGIVNMSGRLTLTSLGEAIRIDSGDATNDPFVTFYKQTTRQGYIQHNEGASTANGFRVQNDIAAGAATAMLLANTGGVDGFRYIVGASNYAVWHTGNLTLTDLGGVPTGRTITAGNGLTGGGDLSANRSFTLGTPTSVTNTSTNSVTTTSHTHELVLTAADLNGIYGYTPVNPTRQVIAGNGLTGGGSLAADRTLAVGQGTGITVAATTVSVDATVWRDGNQPTAAQIGSIYAGNTQGAIGTYAFALKKTAGTINPGSTVTGTDLYWSNSANSAVLGIDVGTWRAMGVITNGSASLALRIS